MGEEFIIFGAGMIVGFVIGRIVGKNESDSDGGKVIPPPDATTGGGKDTTTGEDKDR